MNISSFAGLESSTSPSLMLPRNIHLLVTENGNLFIKHMFGENGFLFVRFYFLFAFFWAEMSGFFRYFDRTKIAKSVCSGQVLHSVRANLSSSVRYAEPIRRCTAIRQGTNKEKKKKQKKIHFHNCFSIFGLFSVCILLLSSGISWVWCLLSLITVFASH